MLSGESCSFEGGQIVRGDEAHVGKASRARGGLRAKPKRMRFENCVVSVHCLLCVSSLCWKMYKVYYSYLVSHAFDHLKVSALVIYDSSKNLDISGYFWTFLDVLMFITLGLHQSIGASVSALHPAYSTLAPMEICSWQPLLKGMGSHSKASEELFFKSFLLIVKENPESFEAFVGQRRRECFPEVAMVAQEVTVNVFATSPSRKCHRYMVKL